MLELVVRTPGARFGSTRLWGRDVAVEAMSGYIVRVAFVTFEVE